MNLKVRRAINAFVLGTLVTGLALLLQDWQKIVDSVTVGDWASLQTLFLALIGGAIGAGLRALQSNVASVPSPEPQENAGPDL